MPELRRKLRAFPAVVLIGPRQVGKTTLSLMLGPKGPKAPLYLDLEDPADRAKLQDPAAYFASVGKRLVILDEVQALPHLFPVLRGVIDAKRREGQQAGQFLLLGSASLELLQQSSESLAGRVDVLELTPFLATEVEAAEREKLWRRGGFPRSFLARNEAESRQWRAAFLRTYLERDIPQLGPRIAAETLRRFWTMLAHQQGGLFNASALASGLGLSGKTVAHYLDVLSDVLLVRRLPPFHANVKKRLVKAPKTYVRDSGLLHSLLGIHDQEALLSHPVCGGSWEGFVLENLIAAAGPQWQPSFYRTATGVEVDLVLEGPGGQLWVIEIKRTTAPKVERGLQQALADLNPARSFLVYPGTERYPLPHGVEAMPLPALMAEFQEK